jgi:hypothetical protein
LEAGNDALAPQLDEGHVDGETGFEPDASAGRHVEPEPLGGVPIEHQCGIDVREVEV